MKQAKIIKTEENNRYIKGRGLPKGCQFCLKGQKAVLFINGLCQKPNHCSWYCPISKERRDKGTPFADEIEITSNDDLIEEINMVDAKGMSITGGEPLSKLNLRKTLDYIEYVKEQKSRRFHIHLYTNGLNFDELIANELAQVGLDEIRFHPPKSLWTHIKFALNKGFDVGAEVPVIPNKEKLKELQEFIKYLDHIGVDFINLNEFEFCFPNSQLLKERGYQLKKGTIASVVNSQEVALDLITELSNDVSLKIHFCPIRSKDYYQLKYRYLRRAKNVRLPYEVISDEGLLIFGQIEGNIGSIEKLYNILLSEMKIDKNLMISEGESLKLPFDLSMDNRIISLYEKLHLTGSIVEMTPFREKKYQQVTEKTPIKLFKKEFGYD
ncbi:MAG: 4Fe-4S cluster-binding domain-containing protein [Candidatus Thorarchaeota archaeon]